MLLHGFDPIIANEPHCMILGSMPSVVSLEQQEYYGFKHNRFWKIMAAYYDLSLSHYQMKINCIKDHGILLWDVIGSCERIGSLDSAIRSVQVNDIEGILTRYPSITHIICNGKKSYELFMKHVQNHSDRIVLSLPSTSNANRTIKEDALFHEWFAALDQVYRENNKK